MCHMRAAHLAARASFAGRRPARTHLGLAFLLESSTFVTSNPINNSSILVLTRSDSVEFLFLNNIPRRRHWVPTPRRHWRSTASSRDLYVRAIAASPCISLAGAFSGRWGLFRSSASSSSRSCWARRSSAASRALRAAMASAVLSFLPPDMMGTKGRTKYDRENKIPRSHQCGNFPPSPFSTIHFVTCFPVLLPLLFQIRTRGGSSLMGGYCYDPYWARSVARPIPGPVSLFDGHRSRPAPKSVSDPHLAIPRLTWPNARPLILSPPPLANNHLHFLLLISFIDFIGLLP